MTINRVVRGDVRTVWIGSVRPELGGGRFPVKREVGDKFKVTADILREGHEALTAVLKYRTVKDTGWHEVRMQPLGNDSWVAEFPLEENTRYLYTIEAYPDPYRTWAEDLKKRLAARMEVTGELLEGAELLRRTLPRAAGADRKRLEARLADFEQATMPAARARILLDEETVELVDTYPDRSSATRYDLELEVVADRPLARFAAWYEMFPRSQGKIPGCHGTFKDCIDRLPEISRMGFDVVYLPPIHPIGQSFRKGKNNSLTAGPEDPGSPWAIGNLHGGHKAVEAALGTLDDFRAFIQAARDVGIEIALDYALQCSPDHPYVREHPEWFYARPDGTIKYAENPPKKYQDIYPLNFYCRDRQALWEELKSILLFWIEQGVRIFRVDNPHTKPIPFWAWIIGEIQAVYPDVIFLSEAFTRPKVMQALAKVGFTQSYTYFTWRNFKQELIDYFSELSQGEMAEYFRGNLFTNTPDILPPILQQGGRGAFKMRLALAATLSPLYGIYSGYELCEDVPIPGTEEYQDSEKYEIKLRDWDAPGHLKDYVAQINRIRRENPALQEYRNLRFYRSDDDNVLFFGKRSLDGQNTILVAVNLDPFELHQARLELPLQELGIGPDERFRVHELITDGQHLWRGPVQTIRLDPGEEPVSIFRVNPFPHKDYGTPCY
ncbi:MAG TPA: alpha-1,4-glucan--maltose-1-phosphate maltosyltransferase [Candidatus Methylomirabilis sp.]|nr:alpha-1,4-glucan--maltose-1-phosphate maltosyltransferase [Candidatus Methylomirabilis sp.]